MMRVGCGDRPQREAEPSLRRRCCTPRGKNAFSRRGVPSAVGSFLDDAVADYFAEVCRRTVGDKLCPVPQANAVIAAASVGGRKDGNGCAGVQGDRGIVEIESAKGVIQRGIMCAKVRDVRVAASLRSKIEVG